MSTVREIIKKKGSEIWSVEPGATVHEALRLMAEKDVGALMVMSGDSVDGIISERDCARKVDVQDRTTRDTKVSQIMTSKVISVQAGEELEDCMQAMIDRNIRHLPVYEGKELIGVLSVRDVLKEVIEVQRSLIAQLERYITGGGR